MLAQSLVGSPTFNCACQLEFYVGGQTVAAGGTYTANFQDLEGSGDYIELRHANSHTPLANVGLSYSLNGGTVFSLNSVPGLAGRPLRTVDVYIDDLSVGRHTYDFSDGTRSAQLYVVVYPRQVPRSFVGIFSDPFQDGRGSREILDGDTFTDEGLFYADDLGPLSTRHQHPVRIVGHTAILGHVDYDPGTSGAEFTYTASGTLTIPASSVANPFYLEIIRGN